jgi:hypothetical protein
LPFEPRVPFLEQLDRGLERQRQVATEHEADLEAILFGVGILQRRPCPFQVGGVVDFVRQRLGRALLLL